MKIILSISLMTSLLFPVGGVVIFNDGTMIEGDVVNVSQSSVSITPIGLTFPEEILMENVDTLRLYDGEILSPIIMSVFYTLMVSLLTPP